MTRLGDQRGFTLIEVLVAATLFLVILGATLGTLSHFDSNARLNGLQNDSQEYNRVAIDRAARDIRNGASSTAQLPEPIEVAGDYDLVYQDVDPAGPAVAPNERNVRRVRYCLADSTTASVSLWRQTAPVFSGGARVPRPSTASCPSGAWAAQQRVATDIVNRFGGANRPLFVYDDPIRPQSSRLRIQLWVDVNPGERPRESRLDTAVLLRNQNRAPSAAFSWAPGAPGQMILNASGSSDPDGDRLSYRWYDDALGPQSVGSGVTLSYPIPAGVTRQMRLRVSDAGGYEASASASVTGGGSGG